MSYIGPYRNGDYVPLLVQCRDGNDTPTVPDDCPQLKVWAPDGTLAQSLKVPPIDKAAVTGLFEYLLRLGPAYTQTGLYRASFYYTAGGRQQVETQEFNLAVGGDPAGAVVSMFYYQRPEADFIVQLLDGGSLVAARNPRL